MYSEQLIPTYRFAFGDMLPLHVMLIIREGLAWFRDETWCINEQINFDYRVDGVCIFSTTKLNIYIQGVENKYGFTDFPFP